MANHLSGKNGTAKKGATAVAELAMWNMDVEVPINARGTNSSGGWKKTSSGTKHAKGKLKFAVVDGAQEEIVPGEQYDMEFHMDDSGSNYYSGNVTIGNLSGLEVDMDEGKDISSEFTWEANGALTANGNVPRLTPSS